MLDYHYWARDRVLAACASLNQDQLTRDMGNSFRSIRDTLGHLVLAEQAWLSRWRGASPTSMPSPSEFTDLGAIRTAWAGMEKQICTHVDGVGEDGIARVHDYKLLSGAPGRSPFWQMLQHVVNHGSYHRGQITTMLRQLGAAPPQSMDMIAFYRERGA